MPTFKINGSRGDYDHLSMALFNKIFNLFNKIQSELIECDMNIHREKSMIALELGKIDE